MGNFSNVRVEIEDSAATEKFIRKFKRLCESFGVVKEYRKRQDYKKPSVRMKEKTEAAQKRRIKAAVKGRRSSKI